MLEIQRPLVPDWALMPDFVAGTPEAIEALRAGNIKALDALELAWVNAYGPRPAITPDMCAADSQPDNMGLLAVEIIKGGLPDGRTAYVWAAVETCPRCWHRRLLRAECRRCEGYGYLNDEGIWTLFYCDADANVIYSDA